MGLFDGFRRQRATATVNVKKGDEDSGVLPQISSGNMWPLIGALRKVEMNRDKNLATYRAMEESPIISSALDLWADDATQ